MTEGLLFCTVALLALMVGLILRLLGRLPANQAMDIAGRLGAIEKSQERAATETRGEFTQSRQESGQQAHVLRQEVHLSLKDSADSLVQSVDRISYAQQQRLEDFSEQLATLGASSEAQNSQLRQELRQQLESFGSQLAALAERIEGKADNLRTMVEAKLGQIQNDNALKLDQIRATVDEKLQGTLNQRLGESFKLVSERLEMVHNRLGEVQSLASGVGDLKRVLTNVKTRGTWGEVQLGNLLEQILTPDQYERNVRPKPMSGEVVEFAIKLPGAADGDPNVVWLPIDVKFPKEQYELLVDASERGDATACEQATKNLETGVRSQARTIREKYIAPPYTTDFGLLYLPTEGLYAEVLRRPGLVDALQREQRVVIVGPTTLAALLNSLQMGSRTLAVQKHSSEVWKILGAVKMDFGRFGDILDKVKKKLDETGNTIDAALHRSRQIERKLTKVEALPTTEELALLVQSADDSDVDEDDSETAM